MMTVGEREFIVKLIGLLRELNKNLEELNANLKRNNKEDSKIQDA